MPHLPHMKFITDKYSQQLPDARLTIYISVLMECASHYGSRVIQAPLSPTSIVSLENASKDQFINYHRLTV